MSDGNNILVNGDFEATGADEATGAVDHGSWFTAEAIDGWQATEGLIEIQDTPARSGSTPVDETGVLSSGSVLELDSYDYQSGCWYANGREADSTVTQTFDLEEASNFSFGFSYAATCSAKTSDFSVTLTDSEGNVVLFQEFSAKEDNLEVAWQRFEAELDLDAGSYTLSFSSSQYEDRDTVGALVDNVSLVDTAPAAEDDCYTLDLGETEVLDVNAVMGTETENVTVLDEDFSGTHYLKHLDTVASSDMAAWKGAAFSNACSDGVLLFEPVDVSELETGSLSFTIESDGRNRSGFEAADSRYGDSIRIEVSIDGGEFVLLDLFEVRPEDLGLRADLQTFVGSQTGQTFGADKTGLSYDLPEGASSVQLRFITNLSAYDEIIKFDDVLIEGERTVETGYESGLLANDTDGNGEPLEIVSVEGVDLFDTVEEEVTVFEENFDEARKKLEKLDTVEDSDLKGKNGVAVATKRSDGELEFEEVDIDGLNNETFSFSLNADLLGCQKFESYGWARDFVEVQARFDDGSYQTIDIFDVEWRGGEQVFVGRNSGQEVPVADGFVDLSYDLSALAGDASTAQIKLIAEVTAHGEIFEVDDVSLAGTFTQRTGDGIATLTLDSGAEVTIKSDGSFSYNANGQFAYLAEGEETTDTFSYTVQDAGGNTDTATVTIKLVGTNEEPIIGLADDTGGVAEIADGAAGENATELSDSGTIAFTDVDLIDTHTVSVTTLSSTDSLNGSVPARGALTALVSDASTGDGAGEISWTFKVQDSAIDDLAAGQTITQVYTVTVDDGQGGTASQDVTVTVTGTNDAPVVAVTDLTGAVTEDASSLDLTDSGTIAFTDVDLADSHSIDPVVTASAGALGTLTASVTTQTDAAGLGGEITWDYSVSNAAVQYLAEGETKTETFTITLDDGNGGLVDRTIEVTVTGTNDDPVVATTDLTGAVMEDASSPDLMDSGTIAFTDVDLADSHSIDPVVTASAGALGTLTASVTTQTDAAGLGGEITWDYSVSNAAVQYLAEGETKTETFTITLDDGNGGLVDRTIEVTVAGTNDDPVVATTDLIGAVTEDASSPDLTDSGTIAFTDVDLADSHSVDPVVTASAGALGTLTASVTTQADAAGLGGEITWDYSVSNAAVQYLAEGETKTETFTITLDDGNGGLVDRTIEVTVTGTNDDPVVATTDLIGAVTEDASSPDLTDSGTIAFTDVDLADSHSIDPVVTASAGALGTLSASVTTQADAAGLGGEITWDYSVSNAAVQYLADGETKTETFTITLDDGKGGLVDRTIEVTITGDNDDPIINTAASDVSGAVTEDSAATLTDAGTINFSDVDTLDTQTAAHSLVSVSGDKGSITDAQALAFLGLSGLTTSSASQAGSVDWTFSADNALFDHLSCDEELVFTYELAVSDAEGADTIQVEVTVTGTNDLPRVSGVVDGGTTNEDEAPLAIDLLANASDAEGDDLAVVDVTVASDNASRSVTVSVDPSTGELEIDPSQFNDLAVGEQETLTVTYGVVEEDRAQEGSYAGGTVLNAGTFYVIDFETGATSATPLVLGGIVATTQVAPDNGAVLYIGANGGASGSWDIAISLFVDGVETAVDASNIDVPGYSGGVTQLVNIPQGATFLRFDSAITNGSATVTLPGGDNGCGSVSTQFTLSGLTFDYPVTGDTIEVGGVGVTVSPDPVPTTATLIVEGRNDDPVAADDDNASDALVEQGFGVPGDDTATGNVLSNDTDADTSDVLQVIALTDGTTTVTPATPGASLSLTGVYGSLEIAADGTWTYTLDNSDADTEALEDGDTATETFTYTVSDGNGGTDTATLELEIAGSGDNVAPVANDDDIDLSEDTAATLDLLGNDTDANNVPVQTQTLSVVSINGEAATEGAVIETDNGTITIGAGGTVNYVPDENYNGADSFTYEASDGLENSNEATVTLNIAPVNDAPEIDPIADVSAGFEETIVDAADIGLGTGSNVPNAGFWYIIDFDAAEGARTTAIERGGSYGLTLQDDDTPTNGVVMHINPNGGSPSDAVVTGRGDFGVAVTSYSNGVTTLRPTSEISVRNYDGNTAEIYSGALSVFGSTTDAIVDWNGAGIEMPGGTFDYRISLGGIDHTDGTGSLTLDTVKAQVSPNVLSGQISFGDVDVGDSHTAVVSGATLSGTTNGLAPATVIAMMSLTTTSPAGGSPGTVDWSFDAGLLGLEFLKPGESLTIDFDIEVDDAEPLWDTETLSITIHGTNDAPDAVDDTVTGQEDMQVTGNVLAFDRDDDALTFTLDADAENGSVSVSADGSYTFTPDADFNGSDSFTVLVDDGNGGTDTATIIVEVEAVNDAPVAVDDPDLEATEDTEITFTASELLGNDTDVDNPAEDLEIASVTSGTGGTVVLETDGTVTFTPDADFEGDAEFTYTVTDGDAESDPATVTVAVAGVNDAPETSAIDAGTISEDDAPETIDLLDGQTDPENDSLSVENITVEDDLGNAVVFTDNGDGTITIDPDQFGDDLDQGDEREVIISYDVSDGTDSTPNTATLTVEGADDNADPDAVDDNLSPAAESVANQIATGAQVAPDITYLGNGKFVATWEATDSSIDGSDSAIQARVFNADGSPATNEFTVNVTTNDDQDTPAIAAVGTDQFAIVWKDQNGSTDTVQLRVFDDTGTPQTGEINVSGSATGSINNPSIDTILDSGGNERLAISWDELDPGSDPYIDVRAVVVTTTGTIVGAERVVNTQTSRNQYEPELSSLDNGNYVVTWWDALNPPDGTSFNVKARILDANNNPVSGEFILTSNSAGWQTDPNVTLLDNGNVLFAWRDYNAGSVEARIFNSTGSATAPQFTLNETSAGTEEAVQVQGLVGGGFVAVWQSSDSSLDGSSRAVMARLFNDAGVPLGSEFVVNDLTESTQQTPRVDANPDGGFTVVFSTFGPAADGDSSAIGLVRFNSAGQKISPVTTDENTVVSIQITDLLANDTDADGDLLSITSVSGVSDKGAIVTLNGDGTISYDPTNSSALDDMANGDLETDTFTYTVSDGKGGTDTATVTVSVAGVDDPPVQTNTAPAQSGFTDEAFSYALPADLFTDHDEGGAITYAVTLDDGSPLPSFMSYDPATRTVSYDANAPTLSDVGLYTLRVTATEEDGQSASTTFSLTILDGDLIEGTSGNDYLTGTIQGDLIRGLEGNDTLIGLPGADVLDGGDDNDNLQGEAGNDVLLGGDGDDYLNGGDGADLMDGGAGNDRIYGDYEYGTTGFDTMLGGDGNDQIYTVGYYASDIVDAGAGDDLVQLYMVGNSADISNPEITLGAGADTLQLSYTIANAYSFAIVTDFNVNEDNFDISYLVDNQISGWNGSDNPFGSSGYLRLLQDGADTLFQVDLNGGADGFQTLVVFQNTNATSFNDVNFTPPYPPDGSVPAGITLNGTSGNDVLNGTIGTDTINGLAGNDTLNGGEAADTLDGGDGRDNLNGEAGDDTLIGGDGDDSLQGGDGADFMDGGDGNDRLYADFDANTPGFDTMIGGAGNDFIYYVGYYASDVVDAGSGDDFVQLRLAGHSGDVSIPTITLGTGADTLEISYSYPNADAYAIVTDFSITDDRININNYINNQVTGWNGSDNPFGSAGFLRLVQDGANTLLQTDTNGGADSFQTLLVLQNTIAADFTAANFDPAYPPDGTIPAGITVVGTASGERIDGTIGIDTLSGEGGNDQLYGGGSGDTLNGGDGSDSLNGEGGDDTLNGGDGNDYLNGGDGADYMDGDDGNDTLYADTDYNTPGFDTMIGGAGNDSIRNVGRYANDVVDAGSGDDTVYLSLTGNSVDTALPTITLGSGADTIDLGSSVNPSAYAYVTVTDFDVAEDYVNIDYYVNNRLSGWDGASNPFGAGFMRLVQDGTSSLLQLDTNGGGDNYVTAIVFENTSVDTFTDTNFIVDAATMQGYSPDGSGVNGQVTVGGASGESFNGTFGDDVISGNGGTDTINGANGNDTLSGGSDADVINGGFGQDRIEGGLGADTLSGGDGNDTFVFNLGDGNDTITDFETTELAQDVLELAGTALSSEADVLAAVVNDGLGNVLISVGADTITLENVNTADLSVDDFNIV